ncbi:MAG: FliA/WhiG family RNA polymerase sigma factor [Deltaproteobacteria bacterium]|nr:FliA/WhiG family RNA polymerase sigma factor [Deltaproteobacteria bacterium]
MRTTEAKESYRKSDFRQPPAKSPAERRALIVEYAPLVKLLANRMAMRLPPNVSVDDLIGAGMMGLLDAIDKFDGSRNVQFKTYAEFRIKGAMLDELRSMDWVPRSTRAKIHSMEQAVATIEGKFGRPASDSEIAEQMGIELEAYYDILNKARGIELLSLDDYIRDENNMESSKSFRALFQGDDDPVRQMMARELRAVIADAIKKLSDKERIVISLYYYDELTLKEIGKVLGLTESRISQIHAKAIIKLRAKLKSFYRFNVS